VDGPRTTLAIGTSLTDEPFSFQEVQLLSPVQTSLRILPEIVVGVILDVMTGVIVQHVHAGYLLLFASLLSSVSPLLMAVIHISWPYWWCGFWAVSLSAFVVDGKYAVVMTSSTDLPRPQAVND
jgi:hypothetical protein